MQREQLKKILGEALTEVRQMLQEVQEIKKELSAN